MTESRIAREDETFLGHPKGLTILFLTEMWERFSYYGMRALLIFYLTQHFLLSDQRSSIIYGAYAALVYVMTIVGGVLADRYLGARKAVTFGAILLVAGHFGMVFEGEGSRQIITHQGQEYSLALDGRGGDAGTLIMRGDGVSAVTVTAEALEIAEPELVGAPGRIAHGDYDSRIEGQPLYLNVLYLSLALIITGVGFLKANISTMVGALYGLEDRRRDSGFTLFYMGINMGAFFSALLCGWLGFAYGWKYGFGLAGIGMAVGLVIFLTGQKHLKGKAEPPDAERLSRPVFLGLNREWLCYVAGLGMIVLSMGLVMNAELVGGVLGPVGLVMFAVLVWHAVARLRGVERDRMFAAIYFVLAQIPFWALFEQAGSSLNLFADRLTDRTVMGWTIPAPMFQSLGAGFVMLLAPLMAWLWVWLARRGREPSTPVKFAIGVLFAAGGFLALTLGMGVTGPAALTPVIFVVLIYLMHTIGELCLSPVGLSAVTRLAPASIVGMTMGAWFLYTGLSSFLAGVIARATGGETIAGRITDLAAAKATYADVYGQVGLWGVAIAAAMLAISPLVRRLMHEPKIETPRS